MLKRCKSLVGLPVASLGYGKRCAFSHYTTTLCKALLHGFVAFAGCLA